MLDNLRCNDIMVIENRTERFKTVPFSTTGMLAVFKTIKIQLHDFSLKRLNFCRGRRPRSPAYVII